MIHQVWEIHSGDGRASVSKDLEALASRRLQKAMLL